ncbi:MAG: hypothetical protein PT118_18490 [Aphanizomenon gracile PMC644.10]|nr:hypothetical protein [Aphanizomenon gracile PMC644.10]
MSADKLASFRVDSQLWEQFQGYAKENNTNASALLVAYVKSVVNTGSVITSNPVVNTSIEVNNPSLSLQDIDKRMDDKIKLSIQSINTLSIQDIDNRIKESLADGGIGEAIASSYAGVMGQINGLLEELQALQKQVQELQSIPPAPIPEQLTTDNGQLTKDVECDRSDSDFNSDTQLPIADDIASLLVIEDILSGDQSYDLNYLNSHIGDSLNKHKTQIEAALKIKLNLSEPKYICREFNRILRAMGLTIENKQIKKVETYWVVPK